MKKYSIIFLCFITQIHSTYLVCSSDSKLYPYLMLQEEPRSLFSEQNLKLDESYWIPSMLWQLAALHLFFHDPKIEQQIKKLSFQSNLLTKKILPLNFDEEIIKILPSKKQMKHLLSIFDRYIEYDELKELFFAMNHHALQLFELHKRDFRKMLESILSDLPFEKFDKLPYYSLSKKDVDCLVKALQSKELLIKLLDLETEAFKQKRLVFYRGYKSNCCEFPNPINQKSGNPHALSFGTTLLGGVFFSTDACALRYAFNIDGSPNTFLSLKVGHEHLLGEKCLFRFGPLHPFIQLFCDGEFFHAHTKVPAKNPSDFKKTPIPGYYAKSNQSIEDSLGYVFTFNFELKAFTEHLRQFFKKEGHLEIATQVPKKLQ